MSEFEYLESVGQTNIFDYLPSITTVEAQIGDTAKINIDKCDDMATNYFKNYYPHVIGKAGTIIDKKVVNNKTQYRLSVYGEKHWVYENELIFL